MIEIAVTKFLLSVVTSGGFKAGQIHTANRPKNDKVSVSNS